MKVWRVISWSGGLFRGSFWGMVLGFEGGGGYNYHPCLTLVKIMLETWYLARKYTHICSFRKYTFGTNALLILLIATFLCKKSMFFGQNSAFTQSNSVSCVRDFLVLFFSFCKINGYYKWEYNFSTWHDRQIFLTMLCFSCPV